MKRIIILLFFLVNYLLLFSQGEIAEADKVFYKNENSLAFVPASTGLGLNYRYGKRIDAFKKWIAESDLNIVKHPKEVKIFNSNFDSQKRFIFGKLNETIVIKSGIGRQHELFSKFDKGSIAIRYFYSAGISFALLKPIYYEMVDSVYHDQVNNTYTYYYGTHKFNTSMHMSNDVVGKAPFKLGIDELSVVPGIYAKTGLSFEYSKTDTLIRALEAGVILDTYYKKLPIMATDNNRQIILSVFIAYRWGNIVDGRKYKRKKDNFFFGNKGQGIGDGNEKEVIKEKEEEE